MGGLVLVKKIIPWLLLAVLALYILTGFGITQFRTVESITFGALTKNLSFKIHNNLLYPFIVFLAAHIVLRHALRKKRNPGN